MTYGEQFDSAMECKTIEEAQAWLAREIGRYKTEHGVEPDEARKTIMINLGYMAGYYDSSYARKVKELFGAVHPIFGSADYNETVSPEAAFNAGVELSKK